MALAAGWEIDLAAASAPHVTRVQTRSSLRLRPCTPGRVSAYLIDPSTPLLLTISRRIVPLIPIVPGLPLILDLTQTSSFASHFSCLYSQITQAPSANATSACCIKKPTD